MENRSPIHRGEVDRGDSQNSAYYINKHVRDYSSVIIGLQTHFLLKCFWMDDTYIMSAKSHNVKIDCLPNTMNVELKYEESIISQIEREGRVARISPSVGVWLELKR